MFVNIQGERYEFGEDNSVMFVGETLIHGLYADLDDEYLFLPSECVDNMDEVLGGVERANIPIYELIEYDPDEEPFIFIINALCRYFSREIDWLDN